MEPGLSGVNDGGAEALERVARRVRALRVEQRLSQETVAHNAGLALRHFQKVEAGEVNLTVRSLAKIAQALSVDIARLFDTI